MTRPAFENAMVLVTVLGGSTNPLDATVFSGGMAYLTLSVDGGAEMSPRHQLTSVPYAQIAGVAQNVPDGSITPAKLARSMSKGQVPDALTRSMRTYQARGRVPPLMLHVF